MIIAPDYDVDALEILGQKKNRIILVRKPAALPKKQFRSLLNGVLVQDRDLKVETPEELKTVTSRLRRTVSRMPLCWQKESSCWQVV